MNPRLLALAAVALAIVVYVFDKFTSNGDFAELVEQCSNAEAEPLGIVSACTFLIDRPDVTDESLFVFLSAREVAFRRLGDFGSALADIDRILAIHPDSANTWVRRGQVHRLEGAFELAELDYQASLALEADNFWAWMSRANAFFEQERFEDALMGYERARDIDPNNMMASKNTITTYLKLGRDELAIEALNQAIQIWPENTAFRNHLGLLHITVNRSYDQAIQVLLAANEINPNNEETYFLLGAAHLRKGEQEFGRQHIERFADLTYQKALSGYQQRQGLVSKHLRELTVGEDSILLYRGIAYAWIGARELALEEFTEVNETGGLLSKRILIDLIEEEGILLSSYEDNNSMQAFENALSDYVLRLSQKFDTFSY